MTTPQPNNRSSTLQRELESIDEDHRLGRLLSQYGPKILMGLGALFAALLLLYYFAAGRDSSSESDFINAENNFLLVKRNLSGDTANSNPSIASEALAKLDHIMQSYPQLHAKYDGPLAQLLLSSGQNERALPYAKRLLQRTANPPLAHYATFADATLALAQNKTSSADQITQQLQTELTPQDIQLAVFNKIRLAALTNPPNPQQWQALQDQLLSDNTSHPSVYPQIASLLQDGDVSLQQYIDHLSAHNPQTQ